MQMRLAPPDPSYDSEAFDSMALVNSEAWCEGGADEGGLTKSDLLPQVFSLCVYVRVSECVSL